MEESLADNMYNLAIESDNNDDDVDCTYLKLQCFLKFITYCY